MATTALTRTNGRKPTKKQLVEKARAGGTVARRPALPDYLLAEEVTPLFHAAPTARPDC